MKIKDDFILRKVADTYVVVPVNSMTLDFNGIINLNETGAFLFELLQKGATKEELLDKMLEEYDVPQKKASEDIDIFIQKVKDADILE
ncbi:MAG: PqqD family protein [Ruminococcus sp.]|nr:PqqD family protein [Ruminococcus sp.]